MTSHGRLTLHDLQPGERARVAHLHTEDHQAIKKIIAMGLFPKTEVKLVRRFPTFVFESGHSRFAIDADLARCVFVQRKGYDL